MIFAPKHEPNKEDQELKALIQQILASRHMPSLRHLDIQVDEGTVTVRGRVRTFYEKQTCTECCRRVPGLERYIDQLDVASPEELAAA